MSRPLSREQLSWIVVRVLLCGIIAAHGWARLLNGAVEPFGVWLNDQGLPIGVVIAYAITIAEIAGTPLLAIGRFIPHRCILYAGIYAVGLALVHAPEGWFVVGLGRNGMEYSVLLITCLLCIAYQAIPGKGSAEDS